MICEGYGFAELFTLSFTSLLLLLTLAVGFTFSKALISQEEYVTRSFVISTIVIGISCIFSTFVLIWQFISCDLTNKILIIIHGILWMISTLTVAITFIGRLHQVFSGTSYEHGKKISIFLYILFCILLILSILSVSIYPFSWRVGYMIASFGIFMYVLTSGFTLFLFMHGLFQVQSDCRSITSVLNMPQQITESEMSERQIMLISTMSRYVVLASIVLIITAVAAICIALQVLIIHLNNIIDPSHINTFFWFSENWLMSNLFCNFICLTTQFRFFGQYGYYKLCKKYDNCCKYIIYKAAILDMERKRKQMLENMNNSRNGSKFSRLNTLYRSRTLSQNNSSATNVTDTSTTTSKNTMTSKTPSKTKLDVNQFNQQAVNRIDSGVDSAPEDTEDTQSNKNDKNNHHNNLSMLNKSPSKHVIVASDTSSTVTPALTNITSTPVQAVSGLSPIDNNINNGNEEIVDEDQVSELQLKSPSYGVPNTPKYTSSKKTPYGQSTSV